MPDVPMNNPEQFYQGSPLLTVPDVPATAEFYRSALGFKTDPGGETPDYCVVWRDNAAVHLARGDEPSQGMQIFFWVRDVNALYADVVDHGVTIDVPLATRSYGIRDFSIRDPNGVTLVFGQDWD
jgi:catechol 2,3-dioxygenase-like lactoylglutathione lyase family enzyme